MALYLCPQPAVDLRERRVAEMFRNFSDAITSGHPYELRDRLINTLAWLEIVFPGTVPTLKEQIEAFEREVLTARTLERAKVLRNQADVLMQATLAIAHTAHAKVLALES